jgi:hypothetical protein
MAFTPFLQGTKAQGIIDNYLNNTAGGLPPFPSPSTNPYIVDSTPYIPPAAQPTPDQPDTSIPNCDELYPGEGRVYDPVLQACVLPDVASDGNERQEFDRDEMLFRQMQRDPSTPFGASNLLDDYQIDSRGGDNIFLRFDPEVNRPGAGLPLGFNILGQLADSFTGGPNRRQNTFNAATQTLADLGYGQQLNNGTFQVFNPQQYFNTVKDNQLGGLNASGGASTMTVGQAVDSVMNPVPAIGPSESGGSPIAEDLSGSLLFTSPLTSVDSSGNRTRNDTAYRAEVARNIERNKRNFGTSGFTEGIGFTRGR